MRKIFNTWELINNFYSTPREMLKEYRISSPPQQNITETTLLKSEGNSPRNENIENIIQSIIASDTDEEISKLHN